MKYQAKRNIKRQVQAILFCAIAMWMLVNGLASLPAMAHPLLPPSVLEAYSDLVMYNGYVYGTDAEGREAIAYENSGSWDVVCSSDSHFSGVDLVDKCEIPIGSARHLKVLKHKGMSHDMYVARI